MKNRKSRRTMLNKVFVINFITICSFVISTWDFVMRVRGFLLQTSFKGEAVIDTEFRKFTFIMETETLSTAIICSPLLIASTACIINVLYFFIFLLSRDKKVIDQ